MSNFIEIIDVDYDDKTNILVNLDLVSSIYPRMDGIEGSIVVLTTNKTIRTSMNYLSLKKIINNIQRKS